MGSFVMMATCDRIEDRQFCYSSIDAGLVELGAGGAFTPPHKPPSNLGRIVATPYQ